MEMKLAWICCACLLVTLARGATLTTAEVGRNTTVTTDRPRDVQSVSENQYHSSTPTLMLLKELVSTYDNETEYTIKKIELTTVSQKVTSPYITTASPFVTTSKVSTVTNLPTTTNKPVITTERIQTTTESKPSTTPRVATVATTTVPASSTTVKVTTIGTTSTTTIKASTVLPFTSAVQEPVAKIEPRRVPSSKGSYRQTCPRPEDIHPCECVEISSHQNPEQIETVAFCKNIRNSIVLKDAMKGMRGHYINYFVLDSCNMPPFPNGLLNNVGVGWMEVLNSTVQFHGNFFSCSSGCW